MGKPHSGGPFYGHAALFQLYCGLAVGTLKGLSTVVFYLLLFVYSVLSSPDLDNILLVGSSGILGTMNISIL